MTRPQNTVVSAPAGTYLLNVEISEKDRYVPIVAYSISSENEISRSSIEAILLDGRRISMGDLRSPLTGLALVEHSGKVWAGGQVYLDANSFRTDYATALFERQTSVDSDEHYTYTQGCADGYVQGYTDGLKDGSAEGVSASAPYRFAADS